jgi:hypothetical protein
MFLYTTVSCQIVIIDKIVAWLPDGIFHTKNHKLDTFWSTLEWEMFVYFTVILNILRPFGLFYVHLEHCTAIWYFWSLYINMYIPFWYVVPRTIWQPCPCFKIDSAVRRMLSQVNLPTYGPHIHNLFVGHSGTEPVATARHKQPPN